MTIDPLFVRFPPRPAASGQWPISTQNGHSPIIIVIVVCRGEFRVFPDFGVMRLV